MSAVRCKTAGCYWTGNRKTDLPDGAELPKPCPNGHPVVVGGPPPTSVETTPSGIRIEFWDSENAETGQPQTRRYLVNGERLPSATTILGILDKPALLDWAARLAREGLNWREVRDEAGDRGTNAHALVLDVVTGKRRNLASLPPDHRPYGMAAMSWVLRRGPKVIEAERMVASLKHGFSGRTDLLFEDVDGRLVLADHKTISGWHYRRDKDGVPTETKLPPYDENALQLDLYAQALVESGYPKPDYGLVVRLGPDGQFDETPFLLDPSRGLRILGAYQAKAEAHKALAAGLPDPVEEPALAVAA